MLSHYRLTAPALALCLALAGCAAPVQYHSSKSPAMASADMPQALGHLQSVRGEYQKTVQDSMGNERKLTNSLIGAGAVALGLALGHVNTNAITGVALGAGTAYTLGNVNLSRQPVMVYLAGIDALNCTEKAVLPLYTSEQNLTALRALIDGANNQPGLAALNGQLVQALVRGEAVLAKTPAKAVSRPQLKAAIDAGQQVRDTATATLRAGRDYLERGTRAAREVVAAVNGIDAAVARAIVEGSPDLSAVPGLVAGLAGAAGAFVPTQGIDTSKLAALSQTGKELATAKSGDSGVTDDVADAALAVIEATMQVAAINEQVRSLLPSSPVLWPEDAFKHCGVAQVVSALSASTAGLEFKAGVNARQEFDVHGGVKPYFVRFDGPVVEGLNLRSPVRFDNLVEVSVDGSKLTQPLQTKLRVVDSSPTPRALMIPLRIVAADDKKVGSTDTTVNAPDTAGAATAASGAGLASDTTTATAAKPAAGTTPSTAKPLAPAAAGSASASLAKVSNFKVEGDERSFSLVGQSDDGKTVSLTVKCPDASTKVARAALAKGLLKAAGITAPTDRHLKIATVPEACAT
jgi:hypothetical protein